MKPYPGCNLPEAEKKFNNRLSRARMTIEQAFGRLKSRWKLLDAPSTNNINTINNYIVAGFILHNLVESMDMNSNCHNDEIQIDIDDEYPQIISESDIYDDIGVSPKALLIRDTIKNSL